MSCDLVKAVCGAAPIDVDVEEVEGCFLALVGGGANVSFSASAGMAKDGRRQSARESERERWFWSRYCMFGGTDWDVSRAIGPDGIRVTGISISEAGVPWRSIEIGVFVTVRHGEMADTGGMTVFL